MHYRGVYRQSWWERFKSRIGLEMASNAQRWWTSGSWKRWPLMRTSAVFYRLMAPSCTCSARMDSTKWALDTVALSGYVTLKAAWFSQDSSYAYSQLPVYQVCRAKTDAESCHKSSLHGGYNVQFLLKLFREVLIHFMIILEDVVCCNVELYGIM